MSSIPLITVLLGYVSAARVVAEPTISADTPQQIGLNVTQYVSIVLALIALIGTFVSKKAKSPADELAKAEFAYTKIKERLEEVDNDRKYLQDTNDYLREKLKEADQNDQSSMEEKRKLRDLVEAGEERIRQLKEENQVLNDRLTHIAVKVRNGDTITLEDVYGNVSTLTPATGNDLGDLELTVVPERKEA